MQEANETIERSSHGYKKVKINGTHARKQKLDMGCTVYGRS